MTKFKLTRSVFTGQAADGRSLCRRVVLLALLSLAGCGDHSVPSSFVIDAGEAGAPGTPGGDGGLNVGDDDAGDPTLGGPCDDDGQCDDGIPCTTDTCDRSLLLCRHTPDASVCPDDGNYCNGVQVCDPRLGCAAGEPVSCTDLDSCTIDTCVEQDHSCQHSPRDADGDGDPVWNCPGGGDCDDTDPNVSSKLPEICRNGKDDNCDGHIDETATCVTPAHDQCSDALLVAGSGSTSLSMIGTAFDYPTACAPSGQSFRDVVVALSVPDGPVQDIDVVAISDAARVSLGTAAECGDAATARCSPSVARVNAADPSAPGSVSRLHFYGVGPGNYPLYVATAPAKQSSPVPWHPLQANTNVELSVKFSPASSAPANETCGTAAPLLPRTPVTVSLASAKQDMTSACYGPSTDLVYEFTLAMAQDVHLFASPLDTLGVPELSLRDASCRAPSDELTCRVGIPASLFAPALPAGQYFVAVSATGPSDLSLLLEVTDPSASPADEGCANPAELALAQTVNLALNDHADAVNLGCLPGAPDSTHRLTLAEPSDVLLLGASSNGDTVAVSLGEPSCDAATRLACGLSTTTDLGAGQVFTSAARAHAFGVPAGSYRVVAESATGNPLSLTAFARGARPTTLVAFADDCSAPFEIPATGGRFQGNTANANADYDAGCDVGSQAPGGAPDQMLHLKLTTKSRVLLDMSGSHYQTMLSVRSGTTCPGSEVQLACAAGYMPDRSFLDLDLESGDYYVQVDGYAGDSGAWLLDIYVVPDG